MTKIMGISCNYLRIERSFFKQYKTKYVILSHYSRYLGYD